MLDQTPGAAIPPPSRLDTRVAPVVRVVGGALDEDPSSPHGIIIVGRIDPATLRFLKIDKEYQRQLEHRADIWEAMKQGVVVPSIEVGVRGLSFESDGADFVIRDPAYIIDGWQRVGTALTLLEQMPQHPVRIFATIHFGTDVKWERHRFTNLNKNIRKISPNLHMRNMRDTNEAVLTLYGLSENTRDFALYRKVTWRQNALRGELMTAQTLAKTAMYLHAHATAIATGRVDHIATSIQRAAASLGLQVFRRNVHGFFDFVEECWGVRTVEYRNAATHLKSPFLTALARLMSDHLDFWDEEGRRLEIAADLRRKLKSFPLRDPHVAALAGSAGTATVLLRQYMVDHINSGRRTGHLKPRSTS